MKSSSVKSGPGSFKSGFLFSFLSFSLWGIFPLYWRLLSDIKPLHILSFRVLLSVVLVGSILLIQKNINWLLVFKDPKKAGLLVITSLLICLNWAVYIWAVNSGYTLAASMGYYINPLVSIVLGMIFFRERLGKLQWIAVSAAFFGVLLLTVLSGTLPWISLILAFTFGFYSLVKKKLNLSALESLGAETLASVPVGVLLLFFSLNTVSGSASGSSFVFSGVQGLSYMSALSLKTWLLLSLCGVVTAVPLYCFARGAKLLPLSAIGFSQFINPTIQFFLGLFIFHEAFPPRYFIAFAFIWTAVIIYIISLNIRK